MESIPRKSNLTERQMLLLRKQRKARELKGVLLSSPTVSLSLWRKWREAKAELNQKCLEEGLICP